MKALPFIAFTLVAAATAAIAAYASASLTLPIWAMFLGWVRISPAATRSAMAQ